MKTYFQFHSSVVFVFSAKMEDWFLALSNSAQQCFFKAAVADKEVLNALTVCREQHGGPPCVNAIPEAAVCLG